MSNNPPRSKCHGVPVKLAGGRGDFRDSDRAVTMHYECTSCLEPCDLEATDVLDADTDGTNDTPVNKEDCWLWAGNTSGDGHAMLGVDMAYRVIYEDLVGDIPAGLELDHLCENGLCVNPLHLEPVTHRENTLRHYRKRTHCRNGHLYSDGVYWKKQASNISASNPTGLTRKCKSCHNKTTIPS